MTEDKPRTKRSILLTLAAPFALYFGSQAVLSGADFAVTTSKKIGRQITTKLVHWEIGDAVFTVDYRTAKQVIFDDMTKEDLEKGFLLMAAKRQELEAILSQIHIYSEPEPNVIK